METFKLSKAYSVICETKKTRNGFKHTATLCENGKSVSTAKICYLNRTWERFTYQSVLEEIITAYFDKKQSKKYIKALKAPEDKQFKSVNMVCAMGKVLCKTQKERNDWDKRMLSTIHGVDFPDDFDSLPEDERTRRLKGTLDIIK